MIGELLGLTALNVAAIALILFVFFFAIAAGLSAGRWLIGRLLK